MEQRVLDAIKVAQQSLFPAYIAADQGAIQLRLQPLIEGIVTLLATSLDDGSHRFNKLAASSTLRPEGELAADDGVTQCPFASVVRRFDAVVIKKLRNTSAVCRNRVNDPFLPDGSPADG